MNATIENRSSTVEKRTSASGVESMVQAMKITAETEPFDVESANSIEKPQKQDKERKDEKPATKLKSQQQPKAAAVKKSTGEAALIGITCSKAEDLSEWYQQVILKGELLEFTDIPGCYIYQPASYHIWEFIQAFFNERIRKMKVKNCYFPLFITEANLQREKEHIEGFAAEVAWVTAGGKDTLENQLAVRPTSETAMYAFYSRRIRSYRDLPLKMNQWNSVVRWEFKHPIPFLRSREFLWQEVHTAHLTEEEASKEVFEILDHYAAIYQDLLAIPVVKGKKTKSEQFPGAYYTATLEGFIPAVGRGVQAATSHCLGQHFAKMFDITVEDPNQQDGETRNKIHVWQNSWGFSTRSLGVMVLTHSDDRGLVIPPRVAEIQVVIVPVGITAKMKDQDKQSLYSQIEDIRITLEQVDVRVEIDYRETYNTGYKLNDWEMKGVPLRIEFGPKDAAKGVVTTCRRDTILLNPTASKSETPISDLPIAIPALLEQIQHDLYQRADEAYTSRRKIVREWKDFILQLNTKNVIIAPHCTEAQCEDEIKNESAGVVTEDGQEVDIKAPSMGAKSLCIPAEQPEGGIQRGTICINPKCGKEATDWVMFGRSY